MNNLKIKAFLVLFLCPLFLCWNSIGICDSPPDLSAIWKKIHAGAQVIDVRTPREFNAGHLPMAKNIQYDEILSHLDQIDSDKSKPIVLYCGSGYRAAKALQSLTLNGYTNVVNAGGYDELVEAK